MLHQKVKTLTTVFANFVKGTENLERLLGQQRCKINKVGLSYVESNQNRFYKNLFDKKIHFIFQ